MYFSDQITLLRSEGVNRTVWADINGVKRSEFYAGLTAGVNLSNSFKVYSEEYEGEPALSFDGRLYMVERVYSSGKDWTELNCSELNQKCRIRQRLRGGDGLENPKYSEWSAPIQCAVLISGAMPLQVQDVKAGVLSADIDAKVTVMFRTVQPYDQLCINNRYFEISYIKDIGLRGVWLELYCKEVTVNDA